MGHGAQLFDGVAERARPRRVQHLEEAVEAEHGEEAGRDREEAIDLPVIEEGGAEAMRVRPLADLTLPATGEALLELVEHSVAAEAGRTPRPARGA